MALEFTTAPSFLREGNILLQKRSHWRDIDLFSYFILDEMSEDELQEKGGEMEMKKKLLIPNRR